MSDLLKVPDPEVGRAGEGASAPLTPHPLYSLAPGPGPSTGESHCSALSLRCILLLFPEPLLCFLCLGSSVSCPQASPAPISAPIGELLGPWLKSVLASAALCVCGGGGAAVWPALWTETWGGGWW